MRRPQYEGDLFSGLMSRGEPRSQMVVIDLQAVLCFSRLSLSLSLSVSVGGFIAVDGSEQQARSPSLSDR